MDLGFKQAGFDIIRANEYNKHIWETYEKNHPETYLDKRSLKDIPIEEIPDCDGIIGGPPCQSWSNAGKKQGLKDERGQLFLEFIKVVKAKQPRFFVAENVAGILYKTHQKARKRLTRAMKSAGYTIYYQLLNAYNYGVPQTRQRVFFVGIRKDIKAKFQFPPPIQEEIINSSNQRKNLKDAIRDLKDNVVQPQ